MRLKGKRSAFKTSSLFLAPNTFANFLTFPIAYRWSLFSILDFLHCLAPIEMVSPDLQQDYILNNSGGVQWPVGISDGVYSPPWTRGMPHIKAVQQPDE
jgi:hypothetical protein